MDRRSSADGTSAFLCKGLGPWLSKLDKIGIEARAIVKETRVRPHHEHARLSYPAHAGAGGRTAVALCARPVCVEPEAREVDRRKDWAEQTSTRLARRFDAIRVEDLKIAAMTRSEKAR